LLISCDTVPDKRGINTDHLPVHTELSLKVNTIAAEINPSFWNVNWEDFRTELAKQLAQTPAPMNISDQKQLDDRCEELTKALQEAIRVEIHVPENTPKSKRWWTVTAALTATPSSDLSTQVESYGDEQEGRMPCPLLATLTSSASRGERD